MKVSLLIYLILVFNILSCKKSDSQSSHTESPATSSSPSSGQNENNKDQNGTQDQSNPSITNPNSTPIDDPTNIDKLVGTWLLTNTEDKYFDKQIFYFNSKNEVSIYSDISSEKGTYRIIKDDDRILLSIKFSEVNGYSNFSLLTSFNYEMSLNRDKMDLTMKNDSSKKELRLDRRNREDVLEMVKGNCEGTPTPCHLIPTITFPEDKKKCLDKGCYESISDSGSCKGKYGISSNSCSSHYQKFSCDNDYECRWEESSFKRCEGVPSRCSTFTSPKTCFEQFSLIDRDSCRWVPVLFLNY